MINTENVQQQPVAKYKLLGKYCKLIGSEQINGNDAAIIETKNKHKFIYTSALFTEHIDFDLSYFPLKHLGYKVIVASIMGILAMNGSPKKVRINIALSNRFSENAIDELMNGIILCCSKYKVNIVGLDFKSSVSGLIISTSTTGEVELEKIVYWNGAKENELICVTGDLGSAYAGLILLEREKKVFEADPTQQPDFIGVDYLLERYLKPELPSEILNTLSQHNIIPTSMLNLNNGLASGLIYLCDASKLGCTIFEDKLPIEILAFEKLKELNIVATTIALNGGEDYELLFTIKQDDYEKIKDIKEISVIGFITSESSGRNIITHDNRQFELIAQGF
ncbi:MAG: thiamine-phosphate kinase [Bacteroidales bacterium]|jgi:thiamine-monophosphate kinase|nr:thiamine-phosphate kinase [Bacteroidales bacterium]